MRFYALGFLVLVLLDTTAHVCFKLAATHAAPLAARLDWALRLAATPWVYAAVACYLGTFFVWMTLLRRAPIGPAFAASHLEVIGVMAASYLIFGERISTGQWAGAGLILAGIACLAVSEASSEPSGRSEAPPGRPG